MVAKTIVSAEQWLKARQELLAKEKAYTRQRDELARLRRELPWVKVEKNYVFDGPEGRETLEDLFDGRSQLIVQHFMFGPGWKAGCVGCSFMADHIDAARVHLEHRDVSFVAVSRAPLAQIEAFRKRMGWKFKWVTSYGSDFNYDYHVTADEREMAKGQMFYNYKMGGTGNGEQPGISVFYNDETGDIYHTYSSYGRGLEEVLGTYLMLDATPKGRNETGQYGDMRDWVRHHDRYEDEKWNFNEAYEQVEESDCCDGSVRKGSAATSSKP